MIGGIRMPTYFIPILMMLVVLFIVLRERKLIIAKMVTKRRKTEDRIEMVELAKRFIGKEFVIYAFDSGHQFIGVIKEVSDGAVLIENNNKLEAINLDFVIRIREYPKNKNGKKKSVILD